MMSKSPEEAIVIIDSIAASDYQSHHDRALTLRKGIMELDTQNEILAQNKLLMQQIEALTKQIANFLSNITKVDHKKQGNKETSNNQRPKIR